jgi:hypothetical protein
MEKALLSECPQRYTILVESYVSFKAHETMELPTTGLDRKTQSTKHLYTLKRVISKHLDSSLVVYPYDRKPPM